MFCCNLKTELFKKRNKPKGGNVCVCVQSEDAPPVKFLCTVLRCKYTPVLTRIRWIDVIHMKDSAFLEEWRGGDGGDTLQGFWQVSHYITLWMQRLITGRLDRFDTRQVKIQINSRFKIKIQPWLTPSLSLVRLSYTKTTNCCREASEHVGGHATGFVLNKCSREHTCYSNLSLTSLRISLHTGSRTKQVRWRGRKNWQGEHWNFSGSVRFLHSHQLIVATVQMSCGNAEGLMLIGVLPSPKMAPVLQGFCPAK